MNIKRFARSLFLIPFFIFLNLSICFSIENPKVSIIVPVYKVEKWIRECMDSLIGQTLKEIEIICVDDESPDNCGKILDDYAKRDNRVKVIHQKNRGVSGARNTGIDKATGEYLSFIDSDDYVEKETYETIYKYAKKDNVDILQFKYQRFEDGKNISKNKNIDRSDSKVLDLEQFLKKTFGGYSCDKIFKSEIIKNNNIKVPENIKLQEDACFSYMAFPRAKKFKILPGKFYNYRQRSGSAVHSWDHDIFNNKYMRDIIHSVYNNWDKDGLIEGKEHILLKYIIQTVKGKITKLDYADEILDLINKKLNIHRVLAKCPSWVSEEIKHLNEASNYNKIKPIEDGIYKIESCASKNMFLDICSASKNDGAKLQVWNSNDTDAQKFKINRIKGYYQISPVCSNRLLDVKDCCKDPGAIIQQWGTDSKFGGRQWYIVPCGDGNFKIISRLNFLNLDSGKSKQGTVISCQKENNSISQKFKFTRIK